MRLTQRIRNLCFQAILRREISYFDDDINNGVGILLAKLATDADLIQGLMGQLLGVVVQTAATVIAGLVIAFVNGWALTLIILALMPIMGIAGYMEFKQLQGCV
jgi:ATP-binding cassette subfamily B (MDR/TAP) protein 1